MALRVRRKRVHADYSEAKVEVADPRRPGMAACTR